MPRCAPLAIKSSPVRYVEYDTDSTFNKSSRVTSSTQEFENDTCELAFGSCIHLEAPDIREGAYILLWRQSETRRSESNGHHISSRSLAWSLAEVAGNSPRTVEALRKFLKGFCTSGVF